jgi:phosphopentomutase
MKGDFIMEKRVIWIILDSVGIGELPDAKEYGDVGANTLGNIAKSQGGLNIPNLVSLGIGNICGAKNLEKTDEPKGAFGKAKEISCGKDTTTGHWEIGGVMTLKPFPTFTETGFPKEMIAQFEEAIGTKVLGNYAASGTEIINVLGDEHVKTGYPIVYTSADSVFAKKRIPAEAGFEDVYFHIKG